MTLYCTFNLFHYYFLQFSHHNFRNRQRPGLWRSRVQWRHKCEYVLKSIFNILKRQKKKIKIIFKFSVHRFHIGIRMYRADQPQLYLAVQWTGYRLPGSTLLKYKPRPTDGRSCKLCIGTLKLLLEHCTVFM